MLATWSSQIKGSAMPPCPSDAYLNPGLSRTPGCFSFDSQGQEDLLVYWFIVEEMGSSQMEESCVGKWGKLPRPQGAHPQGF